MSLLIDPAPLKRLRSDLDADTCRALSLHIAPA